MSFKNDNDYSTKNPHFEKIKKEMQQNRNPLFFCVGILELWLLKPRIESQGGLHNRQCTATDNIWRTESHTIFNTL